MKGMLIAVFVLFSIAFIFSVVVIIGIAWTHHPEGIIKARRKSRKERKQLEKNS